MYRTRKQKSADWISSFSSGYEQHFRAFRLVMLIGSGHVVDALCVHADWRRVRAEKLLCIPSVKIMLLMWDRDYIPMHVVQTTQAGCDYLGQVQPMLILSKTSLRWWLLLRSWIHPDGKSRKIGTRIAVQWLSTLLILGEGKHSYRLITSLEYRLVPSIASNWISSTLGNWKRWRTQNAFKWTQDSRSVPPAACSCPEIYGWLF